MLSHAARLCRDGCASTVRRFCFHIASDFHETPRFGLAAMDRIRFRAWHVGTHPSPATGTASLASLQRSSTSA